MLSRTTVRDLFKHYRLQVFGKDFLLILEMTEY